MEMNETVIKPASTRNGQMVKIRCRNNGGVFEVPIGSTVEDAYKVSGVTMDHGPVCVRVNNKTEGMHYRIYHNKDLEFLDMRHPSASRCYTRTLFFVLCKAVHQLWPQSEVVIDIPVSNGYFCDLKIGHQVTIEDVAAVKAQMEEYIAAGLPIRRHEMTTDDAIDLFQKLGYTSKVKLLRTSGSLYTTVYDIDGYYDYYYGSLLTNTRQIYLFGLEKYFDGLLLRIPSLKTPGLLPEMIHQDKMFEIFKEHHRWQDIIGVRTVGDFNEAVENGRTTELINVSEALQEKKISRIADEIAGRKGVKLVLIAGPSSSGKTTTCKRLSIQLLANGIQPLQISLDDYFVDREQTPRLFLY